MRIDANAGAGAAADLSESAKPGSRASARTPSSEALASDQAELSAGQARVQVLAAQVDNFPEIRQEKVAALEDAIQKGTYQVTPEKTAEAILSQGRIVRIAA